MRTILTIGFTILMLSSATNGGEKKSAYDGTWKVTSLTFNGEVFADKELANIKLIIKGNTFQTFRGNSVIGKGTYVINTKKKPFTIDIQGEANGKKYKTLGIFKVEKDQWTMCNAPPAAKKRPTTFASAEGSKYELAVYKKVK